MMLLILAACRFQAPDPDGVDSASVDTSTADSGDTGEATVGPNYTIEVGATGTLPGLAGASQALMNPLNGHTYVLDTPGTFIRYLSEVYVHPTGDYCVGGTEDESGVCRGGVVWTSGRIEAAEESSAMCLDPYEGRLFLLKTHGDSVEVVDVEPAGEEPYTYQRAVKNLATPPAMSEGAGYLAGCAYDPLEGYLTAISAELNAAVIMTLGAEPEVVEQANLGFTPGAVSIAEGRAWVWDTTGHRVVGLRTNDLGVASTWEAPAPILDVAFSRDTAEAWVAMGEAGVAHLRFPLEGDAVETIATVTGSAVEVVADPPRGLGWVRVETSSGTDVLLVQNGAVVGSHTIDGTVMGLTEPSLSGDVPVFYAPSAGGDTAFTVLAPVPDRQTLDPLKLYLLTTVEEPSDANMTLPCSGDGTTFATELALVRANSSAIAALGVPVAMAITDNFAEKAEECGETAIFAELQALGFELGVMLHNRPCYNCSNGGEGNPDYCDAKDPNFIASTSENACFPGDPEYCAQGDWECYEAFLAPRVDVADRVIPGGGAFIVGADRHGIWSHDWIRLYSEVDRPSHGKKGFTLSMLAGSWAYNIIDYDDPRGKNPAPWHWGERSSAWHLGDIDAWDQDAPGSSLLYLSGPNSSTVKLAEQKASGLYMVDYFDHAVGISYRPDDFEAQYQWLRSAVANRRPGKLEAWYFHIHDNGTLNLRDAKNEPVTYDPDGNGPEEPIAAETMLADFVARINSRYVTTGEVEWLYPTEIQALDPRSSE